MRKELCENWKDCVILFKFIIVFFIFLYIFICIYYIYFKEWESYKEMKINDIFLVFIKNYYNNFRILFVIYLLFNMLINYVNCVYVLFIYVI